MHYDAPLAAKLRRRPLTRPRAASTYQINLRDRVVAANGTFGQAALKAIGLTGASVPVGTELSNVSAYYFANGASTRTQGLTSRPLSEPFRQLR